MWIYWFQSLTIGFFSFIRILLNQTPSLPIKKSQKSITLAEIFHLTQLTNQHSDKDNFKKDFLEKYDHYQTIKQKHQLDDQHFNHAYQTLSSITSPLNRFIKIYQACFFLLHYGFFHFGYFFFLSSGLLTHQSIAPTNIMVDYKYIIFASLIFFINHLFSFFYHRDQDSNQQSTSQLMAYPYLRIIPMHLAIIFGAIYHQGLLIFLVLKTIIDIYSHFLEHSTLLKINSQPKQPSPNF